MAYETPILDTTFIAAADLSSSQFCGLLVDTTGKVNVPAAGANAAGFLQNKPTSGLAAAVRVEGITKALTGGTVTPGDFVKVTNTGAVVTASSADKFVGICIATAAAASGTLTTILLKSGVAV